MSPPQLGKLVPGPIIRALRQRGIVLGALASISGLAGEFLLFHERWQGVGAAILCASALLAAISWSRIKENLLFLSSADEMDKGSPTPQIWRFLGLSGALLLWFGSLLAWWSQPSAIFGLQGILWLASIAL